MVCVKSEMILFPSIYDVPFFFEEIPSCVLLGAGFLFFCVTSIAISGVAIGGPMGTMALQSRNKIKMVWNGGPMTGCLSNRVKMYNGFQNDYVRFSFPVLSFCKNKSRFRNLNGIKLCPVDFCR